MEALQELERVQGMLSLMQDRGLSTNHQDDDRFLAHFLLFMEVDLMKVQPCGILNIKKKCNLISEVLPKVLATTRDDAPVCMTKEDCRQINSDKHSQFRLEGELNLHLSEATVGDIATIGFDAMQRANSTLEDFCRSYFMFHGIDVNKPHTIFKFLPLLSFTESYIYQLDIMNEKHLHLSPKDAISITCPEKLKNVEEKSAIYSLSETSSNDLFNPLVHLLQYQGLLTERLRTELKLGTEYWVLERKLCHALTSKTKILIEDVMRTIHLKSFDYRVLNLLLYELRGQQVDELHMEFLSISEFLVEISDDLFDYEDDVKENSFNIFRMFVGVYGAKDAPNMLAKCISEAEEKYQRISESLDPELSSNYWRRCQEATKEGGTTSGHPLGTWSIPAVIVDEELYRSRLSISNSRNNITNMYSPIS